MKIKPMDKVRPTNLDLQTGINELHTCFEDHREKTAEALDALEDGMEAVRTKQRVVSADVMKIKDALGIDQPRTPAGLLSQMALIRNMVIAVVGGASVVIFILKAAYFLWPAFSNLALQFWRFAVEGKL